MTKNIDALKMENWMAAYLEGIAALESGALQKGIYELKIAVERAQELGLHDPLSRTLVTLGDAYRKSKQYKLALQTLGRACSYSLMHYDNNRVAHGYALAALGRLHMNLGKMNLAIKLLQRGVNLLQRHRSAAEPEFLFAFISLICCYMKVEDFDKADKLSRYTHDLAKIVVGPNDAAFVAALQFCAMSAEGLNKMKRADILNYQLRLIMSDRSRSITSDLLNMMPMLDAMFHDKDG